MLNSMPDGRLASAPDPFLLCSRRLARSGIAALLLSFAPFAGALAAEAPVAAEHNPPGDIPDTQVFVAYDLPLGFTIKYRRDGRAGKRPARCISRTNTTPSISALSQPTRP